MRPPGAMIGGAELFREPDAHLGFLIGGATMGQLLSVPMILFGLGLIAMVWRGPQPVTGKDG